MSLKSSMLPSDNPTIMVILVVEKMKHLVSMG